MQDTVAVQMAGFTSQDPSDRGAHDAHWVKIRANSETTIRTILLDGVVVGHIASFVMMGDLDVTYWIERGHWGRGVATAALRLFLEEVQSRLIHGRAAKDNLGSIRVLQKCGFDIIGEDRGFANGRGEEIQELILKLE